MHPRLRPLFDLSGIVVDIVEAAGRASAQRFRRAAANGKFRVRRPGVNTPMWNACADIIHSELRTRNAKVLLSRHLGIPKQRLTDFLVTRSRVPDAELLLQLLGWVAAKRAGRDPIQQAGIIGAAPATARKPSRR